MKPIAPILLTTAITGFTFLAPSFAPAGGNSTPAIKNLAETPNPSSVRRGLASATNDAMTNGGFSSLIKNFDDASRSRFGNPVDSSFTDLNQLVAAIDTAWKDKYGSKFDIGAADLDDSTFAVQPGKDSNSATLLVTADGKNISIPMINQHTLEYWKIIPPDSMNAEKLHSNLVRELTSVRDSQTRWPADKEGGYRVVAAHVAAAIMDQ